MAKRIFSKAQSASTDIQQMTLDGTSFIKNICLLFVVLAIGAGVLGHILLQSNKELEASDIWISHSYAIIDEEEKIPELMTDMLANQRAYLLTEQKIFLNQYIANKQEFLKTLNHLEALTQDDPTEVKRFQKISGLFNTFYARLEQRASKYKAKFFLFRKDVSATLSAVHHDQDAIIELNKAALDSERKTLQNRISALETQKQDYYRILFLGTGGIAALLFLFNSLILYNQSRRVTAEQSLKDSEERFTLAIEGTNDGIFDWDIRRNKIFYSRQFFTMLGHDREAFVGTIDDFKALLHPDDAEKVWHLFESYLRRDTTEFSATYRMMHASGRVVWVQSRAKAVFGLSGKPLRIVGANSDITFLKEYQEHLKQEKQQAEKANRAKSDFLAHMSHEIRTPLTAISGIVSIFERRQANLDDRQKQLVRALGLSTSSLKDLICDVLDFSRIESGDLPLSESDFLLRENFEEVTHIMSVTAREKSLTFSFDYSAVRDLVFRGDPPRLRQVLINLIGNAVKFTDKGIITVTATTQEMEGQPFLKIAVADTGIGIGKDDLELVFERFRQADSSNSRKYQGSGLGLAISKNLVQMMGGTLTLESELGKGSTFTILLPMQKTEEAAAATEDSSAISKKIGDKIRAELQGDNRLLVVDDYEGNITVLDYMLEEIGYAHDIARNGAEAIKLWKEKHYDLVLMDVQMPEMDGYTATKAIRDIEKEKNLPATPIIGMTAHALLGDEDKCIAAGMDAYLPKPIVEVDLKACILKYLKKARAA